MTATAPVSLNGVRGSVEETASKELLQEGVLHALVAAAGCSLSPPKPDRTAVDWTITLSSPNHRYVWEAQVDVQLKCTHQAVPNTLGDFPFTIKNDQFRKLASTHISHPKLLFVMLCPPDVDRWVYNSAGLTALRHSMYWINLYGEEPTGQERSTIRIPYSQRLDPLELCRILHIVGDSEGKPWTF
ncbi:DUF4365 domain-containing protein [Mycobacteroides abscessus]|uniref:DUF4365 domain-containing protein n=1 Tax=Mycobacteroides abscessus TaxID=36809 RepID=UPI0009292587|nr:DUF4365 domain-containing protein [Mycobacteroides abscessus]MDM2398559.1 DUF4365 domain-containing protein [Mycobacteroides abscessus]MDM2409884.1 DUF4365 domain-containing protein [Mycobacteroides abscessus]SII31660.1 Uncharacterised protein [Mycobacteroides abscessus subsp. abscessus]